MLIEIKTIGSSLLTIVENIGHLRNEQTNAHGKDNAQVTIDDTTIAMFIVNSCIAIGNFLIGYYKKFLENRNTGGASITDDK